MADNNEDIVVEEEVVELSPNEVFEYLVDKDTTTEITGFVCEIAAPRTVGAKGQYRLFKFALSNGDGDDAKKIYCCVWGEDLINNYVLEITPNRILRVSGAHTKASKPSFTKMNEGFVSFELSFVQSATVTYHGVHVIAVPVIRDPVNVDFESIALQDHGAVVIISGFLRQTFRMIESRFGNMSYGSSAITNGTDKVNVNITNYVPLAIPLGLWITVTGTLNTEDGGLTTVVCRDAANVVPNPEGRRMEPRDLQRGNRFPKRKAPAA